MVPASPKMIVFCLLVASALGAFVEPPKRAPQDELELLCASNIFLESSSLPTGRAPLVQVVVANFQASMNLTSCNDGTTARSLWYLESLDYGVVFPADQCFANRATFSATEAQLNNISSGSYHMLIDFITSGTLNITMSCSRPTMTTAPTAPTTVAPTSLAPPPSASGWPSTTSQVSSTSVTSAPTPSPTTYAERLLSDPVTLWYYVPVFISLFIIMCYCEVGLAACSRRWRQCVRYPGCTYFRALWMRIMCCGCLRDRTYDAVASTYGARRASVQQELMTIPEEGEAEAGEHKTEST